MHGGAHAASSQQVEQRRAIMPEMKLYRDEGIVLRTRDLGEADRIITFFLRSHGRTEAVAKGIRRTKSRFGARLEPFSLVDVQLYRGRSLDIVTEVATLDAFGQLIADNFEAFTAANAMAETAQRLVAEGVGDRGQYRLLLGALNSLARSGHEPTMVADSYFLRALALSGWELATDTCATCGRPDQLVAFSVPAGGFVCAADAPVGAAHPDKSTSALLRGLAHGDWTVVDQAPRGARRLAEGYVAAYLQWHLERQVKSLHLLRSA